MGENDSLAHTMYDLIVAVMQTEIKYCPVDVCTFQGLLIGSIFTKYFWFGLKLNVPVNSYGHVRAIT